MRQVFAILFVCILGLWSIAETAPSKWESGTIIAVKEHTTSQPNDITAQQYEVSVKVGDTLYVVLYTPPQGSTTVRYRAGTSLPVFVGKDSLTFNDLLGSAHKLPILSRSVMHEQSKQ